LIISQQEPELHALTIPEVGAQLLKRVQEGPLLQQEKHLTAEPQQQSQQFKLHVLLLTLEEATTLQLIQDHQM